MTETAPKTNTSEAAEDLQTKISEIEGEIGRLEAESRELADADEKWRTYVDSRRAAESREAVLASALIRSGGPDDESA